MSGAFLHLDFWRVALTQIANSSFTVLLLFAEFLRMTTAAEEQPRNSYKCRE